MASIQETISHPQWVVENFAKLRDIFPPERTQVTQGLMVHLGFKMKTVGVDWRSQQEMGHAMVLCMHLGLYEQEVRGQGVWIVRTQRTLPPPSFFHMSPAQITVNRILRSEPSSWVAAAAAQIINRIREDAKRQR